MPGGTETPRGGFTVPRGLGVQRTDSEAPLGSRNLTRQGTLRNMGGRGPLEGGLPDAGALIALADVATDRLYVVMENEEGALYLELSDLTASEELLNPDSAVRLAFRRSVRSVVGFTNLCTACPLFLEFHSSTCSSLRRNRY